MESFQGPKTHFIMCWSWRLKSLITPVTLLSTEKYFASRYIFNLFGTSVALHFLIFCRWAFRCGAARFPSQLKAVSQKVYCIQSNLFLLVVLNCMEGHQHFLCCNTVTTGSPELLSSFLSPGHDCMFNSALKRIIVHTTFLDLHR